MTEISKEYGAALFTLALEEGKSAEIFEVLSEISGIFSENPEYIDFLSSPAISIGERVKAVDEALGDNYPEEVVSYIKLLCEKGRADCFFESVAEYERLYDESIRSADAKITSATELSAEEKEKIREKLEKICGKAVNMEFYIDKSLLGGVIAEVDGKVYDGSIKTRLEGIKEVIGK